MSGTGGSVDWPALHDVGVADAIRTPALPPYCDKPARGYSFRLARSIGTFSSAIGWRELRSVVWQDDIGFSRRAKGASTTADPKSYDSNSHGARC